MMRAVIYARFSSELQRDESIEDQVEVCRREAERQGWSVAKVYADRAQSGASRFRPQYQQMLADAERKQFDVLVCEALDRLGRKLADIADLYDRLSFSGVKIHTVTTGPVTQLHIGMLGHHGPALPVGPAREGLARPARTRAAGAHPGRSGLRLRGYRRARCLRRRAPADR